MLYTYCVQTHSPSHTFHTFSHHLFRNNLSLPTICGSLGHFKIHPQLFNVCYSPFSSVDSLMCGHEVMWYNVDGQWSQQIVTLGFTRWLSESICCRIDAVLYYSFFCAAVYSSKFILYGTIKLIQEYLKHQNL